MQRKIRRTISVALVSRLVLAACFSSCRRGQLVVRRVVESGTFRRKHCKKGGARFSSPVAGRASANNRRPPRSRRRPWLIWTRPSTSQTTPRPSWTQKPPRDFRCCGATLSTAHFGKKGPAINGRWCWSKRGQPKRTFSLGKARSRDSTGSKTSWPNSSSRQNCFSTWSTGSRKQWPRTILPISPSSLAILQARCLPSTYSTLQNFRTWAVPTWSLGMALTRQAVVIRRKRSRRACLTMNSWFRRSSRRIMTPILSSICATTAMPSVRASGAKTLYALESIDPTNIDHTHEIESFNFTNSDTWDEIFNLGDDFAGPNTRSARCLQALTQHR